MRAIVWSDDALQDFDSAIAHIAKDHMPNAVLVADRIDAAVSLLAETPIGRPGRVRGTFEKIVRNTPYIVAYAIAGQTITILRVIHGRRNWQDDTWPE